MKGTVDQTDRRLLQLLRSDGRCSVNELAEKSNISRATAYQRLARLKDQGVIRRYTVDVDHKKLGLAISALLLIRVEQHDWRHVAPALLALPGAEWLGAAAGEFDFALLVRVKDVETLRDVVLEKIQAMASVRSSETVLLLEDQRVGA